MPNKHIPFLLSLDYELFFGNNCGTVENCIINPTKQLLTILDKYDFKVSLFVDAGFLVRLKQQSQKFPELKKEYDSIKTQLKQLSSNGHDIQLHIHPHWEDSYFDGNGWVIDTKRYRLHDFSPEEIKSIVTNYKQELESCSEQDVFAFRAGGWCLQPFE